MSADIAFQGEETALKSVRVTGAVRKDSKLSYTRDDLLSLAELEVCKELPSGFNVAILSELDGAGNGASHQQRPGGREYTSPVSVTVGGILGNVPPRLSGRCDNHGRGVKENSSIPNHYSDSGESYHSHSVISSQNPASSGILESCVSKYGQELRVGDESQGADHYLLRRSRAPYRPPCFKKVGLLRLVASLFSLFSIGASERLLIFYNNYQQVPTSFELTRNGRDNEEKLSTNYQKENLDSNVVRQNSAEEIGILKKNVKLEKYSSLALSDDHNLLVESNFASRSFIFPSITSESLKKCCGVNNLTHIPASQVNKLENIDVQSAHTMQENVVTILAPAAGPTDIDSPSSGEVDLPSVALDDNNKHSDTNEFTEIDTQSMHNLDFSTDAVGNPFGNPLSGMRGLSRSNKLHDILRDGVSISKDLTSKFAHWSIDEESSTAGSMSSCGNNDRDCEKRHHFLHDQDTENTKVIHDIAIRNILALLQDEEEDNDLSASEWTVHGRVVPSEIETGQHTNCSKINPEEAGSLAEIQLPDEDSLITFNDAIGHQQTMPMWTSDADRGAQTSVLFESTRHLSSQHVSYGCEMGLRISYPEQCLQHSQNNRRRSFPESYSPTQIKPLERFGNIQISPTLRPGCQIPMHLLSQPPGPPHVDLTMYGNSAPQVTFPRLLQTENLAPQMANTLHIDPHTSLYINQRPNFPESHDLIHSLYLNEQRNFNGFAEVAKPGINLHWRGWLR